MPFVPTVENVPSRKSFLCVPNIEPSELTTVENRPESNLKAEIVSESLFHHVHAILREKRKYAIDENFMTTTALHAELKRSPSIWSLVTRLLGAEPTIDALGRLLKRSSWLIVTSDKDAKASKRSASARPMTRSKGAPARDLSADSRRPLDPSKLEFVMPRGQMSYMNVRMAFIEDLFNKYLIMGHCPISLKGFLVYLQKVKNQYHYYERYEPEKLSFPSLHKMYKRLVEEAGEKCFQKSKPAPMSPSHATSHGFMHEPYKVPAFQNPLNTPPTNSSLCALPNYACYAITQPPLLTCFFQPPNLFAPAVPQPWGLPPLIKSQPMAKPKPTKDEVRAMRAQRASILVGFLRQNGGSCLISEITDHRQCISIFGNEELSTGDFLRWLREAPRQKRYQLTQNAETMVDGKKRKDYRLELLE